MFGAVVCFGGKAAWAWRVASVQTTGIPSTSCLGAECNEAKLQYLNIRLSIIQNSLHPAVGGNRRSCNEKVILQPFEGLLQEHVAARAACPA